MNVLPFAAIYFAQVFAAGFALGAVRVPVLEPRVGERVAELIELPILVGIVLVASRTRQRRTPQLRPSRQLAVGALALAMMLTAEFATGAMMQGQTPIEILMSHDPVSGAFYFASLALFAVMPWVWACAARRSAARGTPATRELSAVPSWRPRRRVAAPRD